MGQEEMKNELEGLLMLMASLSHGLEQVLGRTAATVTSRAGRTVGLKAEIKRKETDLMAAIEVVQHELKEKGIIWPCEPWKPAKESDYWYDKNGKKAMKLVFRNCMVRCALFRYSHEQRQSLCMMNHGLFCGYHSG